MSKFFFSLALILSGISFGYALQQLAARNRFPLPLNDLRKAMQKLAMLFFGPFTFLAAIWIVEIPDRSMLMLPLLDVVGVSLGGGLAIAAERLLRLPPRQAGALFTCGAFANIGSIGGLVAFIFLDERAFALMTIYTVLQPFLYLMIGFPIAKSYGIKGNSAQAGTSRSLKKFLRDPFILSGLSTLTIGALLKIAGVPRPPIFGAINAIFIPGTTFILLITIGMTLKFSRIKNYLRECIIIAGIKFVCVPLCLSLLALLLGYHKIDGGLPMKVVLVVSSMPVAFNGLVASSLYNLDLDVTNSCFLFTTGGLIVTLPILYYLLHLI
ncbi:auxin efflux carrier [Candidatus Moduliflexus flocculans]|uniref:Auxin efflux carrier n=1 Tax=Candidatus Moduliflexus flocculans TaxID=1499966 RepID=A0A081BN34_9BACT|nr:auxin efflux carrier [Candidatus Moduliflexus flocculans]